MENDLTLGSLFSGSGGFELAGLLNGITPKWASEVEPYTIRVTKEHLPQVKHLGDVSRINGAEIEPVDIITFGSPCQDLSIAGVRKGLHEGERSSLFFQAIRIIREMRQATNNKYPHFLVWENVPGAFSSNKGEDFKAVLEAIGGLCENGLSIPRPKKWVGAGYVVGRGWSLAWRVYDAQHWGVPQRRKRIYLVADLAGECAGEILFERKGVSGNPEPGREAWESIAYNSQRSTGRDCLVVKERAGCPGGGKGLLTNKSKTYTVSTAFSQSVCVESTDIDNYISHDACYTLDCRNLAGNKEMSATLQSKNQGGHSLNYINPVVYDARGDSDTSTVPTITGDHNNRITDYTTVVVERKKNE